MHQLTKYTTKISKKQKIKGILKEVFKVGDL